MCQVWTQQCRTERLTTPLTISVFLLACETARREIRHTEKKIDMKSGTPEGSVLLALGTKRLVAW